MGKSLAARVTDCAQPRELREHRLHDVTAREENSLSSNGNQDTLPSSIIFLESWVASVTQTL